MLQVFKVTFGQCGLELFLAGGVESFTAYQALVKLEQYG